MFNDLEAHKFIGGVASGSSGTWSRPVDWLPIPVLSSSEEKFVGLFAIYNVDYNFLAFSFEGDYTVNWGDGTIENYSSEVCEHQYNWSSISSSTVTTDGYKQALVTVTPQTGSHLYEMNLDKLHSESTYNQNAVISWLDIAVSMPEAVDNDVTLKFSSGWNGNWLSHLERLHIYNTGNCTTLESAFFDCYNLQELIIENATNITNISGNGGLLSLRKLEVGGIESMTDFSWIGSLLSPPNVFYASNAFKTLIFSGLTFATTSTINSIIDEYMPSSKSSTTIEFRDLTGITGAFGQIIGPTLRGALVLTGLNNVTNLSFSFSGLNFIDSISLSDLNNVTEIDSCFFNCQRLKTVSLSGTENIIDASNMFNSCFSLGKAPIFDTSSVEDFSYMLSECYALQSVPHYNTSNATDMHGMFLYCYSLPEIPQFNTSKVVLMNSMFEECYALVTIPELDTSKVEDFSYIFAYCPGLRYLPTLDISSANPGYSFPSDGYNNMVGSVTFKADNTVGALYLSLEWFLMSRDSIIETFNSLPLTSGGTIDIRWTADLPNLTGTDIAIATDKGWTVLT